MKLSIKDEPRIFKVGDLSIRDYGKAVLEKDEMITLVTPEGRECDVTGKEWGFYLTPSINARLREQGLKVALVANGQGKLFINAVAADKMALFEKYLVDNEGSEVVCWLDEWIEARRTNRDKEI